MPCICMPVLCFSVGLFDQFGQWLASETMYQLFYLFITPLKEGPDAWDQFTY